jgi:hypothetical protein
LRNRRINLGEASEEEDVQEIPPSTERRQTRLQKHLKQASRRLDLEIAGDEVQDDDGGEEDSEVPPASAPYFAVQLCMR